jgi:glycolate oxidase iron-sulfur subunit
VNPDQILEQADGCVKCGLCLPYCPTYRKSADESESPRGRIALIQGLVSGALADSPRAHAHLDRCLECRACESACPSGVPFGRIMDGVRAWRVRRMPLVRHRLRKGLLDLASRPPALLPLLRIYGQVRGTLRGPGLLRLAGVERVDGLLPQTLEPPLPAGHYRPAQRPRGHVALFTGCLGRQLDAQAQRAALELLLRLGFEVSVPAQAHCCGALHRHDGFAAEAQRQLEAGSRLFDRVEYDAVLTLASACNGELRRSPRLGPRIRDITRFLAELEWPERLQLQPLPQQALVHVPCTQRNLLRDPEAAFDLLARIPGLTLAPLPDNDTCCGGAGTYMLRQPRLSQALLDDKVRHLRELAPTLLITSNTGCALQLAAGIRQAGLATEVCHPVELIARQLPPLEPRNSS